jgi:iron complex transport system substrate-binding protein
VFVKSITNYRFSFLRSLIGLALIQAVGLQCSRSPATPTNRPASAPPRRIIALAPNTVEIIAELGALDRLIGVSEFTVHPPEASHLARIGGLRDPDLESILKLRPDLVILRGRQENLETLCANRGIAVYHDPTNRLADLYRAITDLGGILDRQQQADALCNRIRGQLDDVRRRADGKPRVRVLMSMRSPDRLSDIGTPARGSYLHELIELAGGDNIFGDLDAAYPQVGIEEIVARRPDVILEIMPGFKPAADEAAITDQWRALSAIPAVRDGRIYVITDEYALIPSPRIALLAQKLLALLHPEVAVDDSSARR